MSLVNFAELVIEKVKMNLRSEVRKSYLSYAWWILEPALMVSVFYIVFGVLLRRGGPDFLAFLLSGYIPFQWFSRSVQNCMVSINNGKGLINQIKIPKIFFPLVTLLHDTVQSLDCFCAFAVRLNYLWYSAFYYMVLHHPNYYCSTCVYSSMWCFHIHDSSLCQGPEVSDRHNHYIGHV